MKSGNISILVGMAAAIANAVVDPQPTQMRLGAVAAGALDGAVDLVTVLIDPQAGKVCVLLDANHAAIHTAINGAAGRSQLAEMVAGEETTRAKSFTEGGDQIVLETPQGIDTNTLDAPFGEAIARALMLPAQVPPVYTLSSAISSLEDELVNVDAAIPVLFMVCQATKTVTVASFDSAAHAAAAYALGAAASVKQAEFLSTAPTSGTTGAQFFE